jgi:sec-independent protein translocase protein TatA
VSTVNIGPFQILIIALVFLVLFGRGRISDMMGDLGKGVKSFRKNLEEEPAQIEGSGPEVAAAQTKPVPDQTHN